MSDQDKTTEAVTGAGLAGVAGSDVWTPERKYWLEQQLAAPHMKGPWIIEERWDSRYDYDLIRVVHRTPLIEITIAEWPLRGVQRWSPAYYLIRGHAEMIASAPLYHPNTKV